MSRQSLSGMIKTCVLSAIRDFEPQPLPGMAKALARESARHFGRDRFPLSLVRSNRYREGEIRLDR